MAQVICGAMLAGKKCLGRLLFTGFGEGLPLVEFWICEECGSTRRI